MRPRSGPLESAPAPTEILVVRVPKHQLHLLDEEAAARQVSRSHILRDVIQYSLDPQRRKGIGYGAYLRQRDLDRIRVALNLLVLAAVLMGVHGVGILVPLA